MLEQGRCTITKLFKRERAAERKSYFEDNPQVKDKMKFTSISGFTVPPVVVAHNKTK